MAKIQKITLEEPTQEPTIVTNKEEQAPTMTTLTPISPSTGNKTKYFRIISISLAVVAGLTTGYFLAQNRLSKAGVPTGGAQLLQNPSDSTSVKVGDIFGSSDEKSFRDSATGIIQPGGVEGEGTHHLERGEDESQWVYLTSSVIDLDLFVTTEVELWGETFQGKKAGWLMDVGRLKVVKLNAGEINDIEPTE